MFLQVHAVLCSGFPSHRTILSVTRQGILSNILVVVTGSSCSFPPQPRLPHFLAGNRPVLTDPVHAHSTTATRMSTVASICLAAAVSVLPAAADEAFFESRIRPLLLQNCVPCHGPKRQEADLRLDQREQVLTGVASDMQLVSPGMPLESRLWSVVQHNPDDISMPPQNPLSQQQKDDLLNWIRTGAYWPEASTIAADAQRLAESWREHWAFQQVQYPAGFSPGLVPAPIDTLIDRKLNAAGLSRSPEAPPGVLVRRAAAILIGLPPEATWLEAGISAADAGTWNEWFPDYVDQLLDSPHFGETWARHWMDVARYADTKGYVFQEDREYPDAWKYRDWVIQSLNNDRPYDDFLRRQISADRLPGADDPQELAAMGFLTLGRRFLNNPHDIIDDRIDVISRGMLGLTVSCARCHDHKFDPIPTKDYYSLYGIFASSDEPKNEPSTLRLVDRPQAVDSFVLLRGNPGNRGEMAPRRFLSAIATADAAEFTDGSGRLELAHAITSRDNPLTARVAVNRTWMNLFGKGFVETPSDFGIRTEQPMHHELLDLLAADFMNHDWSLKKLIRRIVLSGTWRQCSDFRFDAAKADPENRLLARASRRRRSFEAQHDAILFASGALDRTIGGQSADIAADPTLTRRAVYARIDRQNLPGLFRTFDLASPDSHAPRRFETTIPQQGLYYLNSPFVLGQAQQVGVNAAISATPEQQVTSVYLQILQRTPSPAELVASTAFIEQVQQLQAPQDAPAAGWTFGFGPNPARPESTSSMTLLTHAADGRLQVGKDLPDPLHGWVFLSSSGGHPGTNPNHCAIRRWTAGQDSRVVILGSVNHPSDQGDGVRLTVVGPQREILSELDVHNQQQTIPGITIEVRQGQYLDFVIDCRDNPAHDSFQTQLTVRQSTADGTVRVWNSESDFSTSSGAGSLLPLAQLAQTLLMSNEFLFID